MAYRDGGSERVFSKSIILCKSELVSQAAHVGGEVGILSAQPAIVLVGSL